MSLLKQNEKEVNLLVAKVMRITFIIFTLVCLLNVVGIFTVDGGIMQIAYIGGSCFLLAPTLLVNVLKHNCDYVKYVNVLCATGFITLLSMTLAHHVVVAYVYAIAIASLYFSKKLNIITTAMTVVGVCIGQILALELETVQDNNFLDFNRLLIFGIIPRTLVLIAMAAIFTTLASRTSSMLSNLLGAEEQEKMLDRMKRMQEHASQTSETLADMMSELSRITEASVQANQRIEEETEQLLVRATGNATEVETVDNRIQDITEQLVGLSKMNHKTALLTDRIAENTQENQRRMNDVTASMEQIHNSTNECKQIISNLGEESKEIIGIIQTITSISSRTNILALNATIEAARAGEHGKGFAVVAEEIQKLSEQTKTAVESIGAIVHEVVQNTENAVVAMEQNAAFTQKGMESIEKANESSTLITSSNEELAEQMQVIDKTSKVIRVKGGEIAESMEKINDNTQKNCNAIEHVTAASEENSAGVESLSVVVEQVKGLSEQLNQMVHNE